MPDHTPLRGIGTPTLVWDGERFLINRSLIAVVAFCCDRHEPQYAGYLDVRNGTVTWLDEPEP